MPLHFLDTSAVLSGGLDLFTPIYLSPLVLRELENIKTSDTRDEHIKYLARDAIRKIVGENASLVEESLQTINQRAIDRFIRRTTFLQEDSNDSRLLAEAALLARERGEHVQFVTRDSLQYLMAKEIEGLDAFLMDDQISKLASNTNVDADYAGWEKFYPTAEQLVQLYSEPSMNILQAHTNEFCEIYSDNELRDILFWTGSNYRPLQYKDIKNSFLNTTYRPRNLEQKLAFDLLQNDNIPVKLLTGATGSGKDILMLIHALDEIKKGQKDRIIFVRNLIPFKDAPEIGYLQGSIQDKISWGLGPLYGILGEEGVEQYEEQGLIEAVNLGFVRGCSWDNVIIYVSEGQNITGGGYKLLVSRCGKNSECWINGDRQQTDNWKFDKNNGIVRLLQSLTGNELFGTVKLIKTERSKTAELASII